MDSDVHLESITLVKTIEAISRFKLQGGHGKIHTDDPS